MEKEQQIAEYLRNTYNPVAVLLHGSRAVNMNRPHSDWDIFLLFSEKPIQAFNREEVVGEDVEWKAVQIPIADDTLLDTFGVQLRFGKVLWEEGALGTNTLAQASNFYAKGVKLNDAERAKYKQYLSHKIHGMEDDINTPYMFLRHQYAFFERASNWWFEMRGEYRKPFYIAIPQILERDPEYHSCLIKICENSPNGEKVEAAKTILSLLFPAK